MMATNPRSEQPQPIGSATTAAPDTATRLKVWDPAVRLFHWSLVGFYLIAWLSAEEIESIHVIAGYVIAALLAFRLVWGLIGTPHARFSDFIVRPATLKRYLSDTLKGRSGRYIGHNPAGAAMVVALVLSLAMTVLLGLSLLGSEGEGILANSWLAGLPHGLLEGGHELFANVTLLLVGLHLLGVLFSSLHHRENLVRSMITGLKDARPNDIDHTRKPGQEQ